MGLKKKRKLKKTQCLLDAVEKSESSPLKSLCIWLINGWEKRWTFQYKSGENDKCILILYFNQTSCKQIKPSFFLFFPLLRLIMPGNDDFQENKKIKPISNW